MKEKCVVCNSNSDRSDAPESDRYSIACNECGEYSIAITTHGSRDWTKGISLLNLSIALRFFSDKGNPQYISTAKDAITIIERASPELAKEEEIIKSGLWQAIAENPKMDFDATPELRLFFFYDRHRDLIIRRMYEYLQIYPDRGIDGETVEILTEKEYWKALQDFLELNSDTVVAEQKTFELAAGIERIADEDMEAICERLFLESIQ